MHVDQESVVLKMGNMIYRSLQAFEDVNENHQHSPESLRMDLLEMALRLTMESGLVLAASLFSRFGEPCKPDDR